MNLIILSCSYLIHYEMVKYLQLKSYHHISQIIKQRVIEQNQPNHHSSLSNYAKDKDIVVEVE